MYNINAHSTTDVSFVSCHISMLDLVSHVDIISVVVGKLFKMYNQIRVFPHNLDQQTYFVDGNEMVRFVEKV